MHAHKVKKLQKGQRKGPKSQRDHKVLDKHLLEEEESNENNQKAEKQNQQGPQMEGEKKQNDTKKSL